MVPLGIAGTNNKLYDSLNRVDPGRIKNGLVPGAGFHDTGLVLKIEQNTTYDCGVSWLKQAVSKKSTEPITVNCQTAEDIYKQLARNEPVTIRLTGKSYTLDKELMISGKVQFKGQGKTMVELITDNLLSVFIIKGNGQLSLEGLNINGAGVRAGNFISSDTAGSSDHYNLTIRNCQFKNFERKNGCINFFQACKSMVADSIVFYRNSFTDIESNVIMMVEEIDKKGYYNAEKIKINENLFYGVVGILLDIYRGGNDESTMGPLYLFKITLSTTVAAETISL